MKTNIEQHTFCRTKDTGLYGVSLKPKRNAKLSKDAINKVVSLLFDSLKEPQKKELSIIMKNQFRINKCVVLRNEKRETEFDNFLSKYCLDIGKKEAIVMSDGETVQFTHDYGYYPEIV